MLTHCLQRETRPARLQADVPAPRGCWGLGLASLQLSLAHRRTLDRSVHAPYDRLADGFPVRLGSVLGGICSSARNEQCGWVHTAIRLLLRHKPQDTDVSSSQ